MKNHLQPVTARANAGIRKTGGCGCDSPAKLAPLAAAAVKIAPKILGSMGKSGGQSSGSSSGDISGVSKGYSTGEDSSPNKKMKSPAYMTDPDPKKGKSKIGEIPRQEEIQQRFKGKYKVIPKKGKINEYTLRDKFGDSVSYTAGPRVENKSMTATQIIKKQINAAPGKKYGKKY
jgi:hypothetical protein